MKHVRRSVVTTAALLRRYDIVRAECRQRDGEIFHVTPVFISGQAMQASLGLGPSGENPRNVIFPQIQYCLN